MAAKPKSGKKSGPVRSVIEGGPLAPLKKQTRSKARVVGLGEVFTAEREVKAMLDLVGDITHLPETTFLEPSCGNGNFLVEIIDRKIATVFARHKQQPAIEKGLLRSIMSIYAVELSPGNAQEARDRTWGRVTLAWESRMKKRQMSPEFEAASHAVLNHNIRICDFLAGREGCVMTEYVGPLNGKYILKDFRLSDPSTTIATRGGVTMAGLPAALCKNIAEDHSEVNVLHERYV